MLTNEQVAEILALATASTPCDGYGPITKSDAAGLADKTARLDGTAHYAKLWCSYLRIENDESLIAAITGNGPTSEVNARFYSCARGAVVSLVEALTAERQRAERAEAVHFGQAGHFCDADRCRFHLHTHVNGVCVSTVGEYFPSYSTGREPKTLNATSLYETMVFRLDESGEPVSWSEIDGDRYQTRDDANAGHVAMIERWQLNTLTSPPPPAGVAYQAPDGACGREYVVGGKRDGKPCVLPSGEHSWCRDRKGEEWHFTQGVEPTAAGDGGE